METISIEQWAKNNEVPRRNAYRWVKQGLLPSVKRKVTVLGVPANITKADIGKGKREE